MTTETTLEMIEEPLVGGYLAGYTHDGKKTCTQLQAEDYARDDR